MRLVRESINFTRGQDPRDAMDIGLKNTIESWLYKMDIHKYELIEKGLEFQINVHELINISKKKLNNIPEYINFNIVDGGFYCNHNELTSLKGSPLFVAGGFICNDNLLENLEYSPEIVNGFYIINNNRLTSLEGLPEKISTLAVNDNLLTSLRGCPDIINGDLFCYNNKLKSLDFFPYEVRGSLFISYTEDFKKKNNISDPNAKQQFIKEIYERCEVNNIKII
jgi:hypothetical protein